MKTVKDILEASVREYNKTIFGNNSEFHSNNSYLQRRGIFYNCLRRQFQYGMPSFHFSDEVNVQNLSCGFRADGSITSFVIDKSPSWGSSNGDVNVLREIKSYSGTEYLDTELRISFDNIEKTVFKF